MHKGQNNARRAHAVHCAKKSTPAAIRRLASGAYARRGAALMVVVVGAGIGMAVGTTVVAVGTTVGSADGTGDTVGEGLISQPSGA